MSGLIKKNKVSRSSISAEYPTGIPRFCEVLLAFGGLLVLSPVLLLCSVLVLFSRPGPILFRQLRVGRNGKVFLLFKFRTMVTKNAGLLITAENDQRVTSVGRFLRKTKLDELPELFNVLIGDMSFVGPRPEVSEFVDKSNPLWQEILKARPGITDPVTLQLRNEEKFLATVDNKEAFYREVIQPFKLNGSLEYLRKKSITNDVKIIAKTVRSVVFPKALSKQAVEEIKLSFVD